MAMHSSEHRYLNSEVMLVKHLYESKTPAWPCAKVSTEPLCGLSCLHLLLPDFFHVLVLCKRIALHVVKLAMAF